MNLLKDTYYNKEYINLYLKEEEEIFEFRYQEGKYIFYNIAIKRPIKEILGEKLSDTYYDLETAYGYGGYYTNTKDDLFLKKALDNYKRKCIDSNIIAEFIRFHPFNDFHNNSTFFNFIINDRKTIYIDLKKTKEERWSNYSSKTRNILRKCQKDLRMEVSDDIDSFMKLYHDTMDRNNANHYYYFKKDYFNDLTKINNVELYNIYKNDTLVSSSFFLFSEDFGHYHLSANNYEYRKYNANYFILDNIFDISKEKKIKYFHLGGGRTPSEEDSLLKFKSKFSNLQKDFYIAGLVFNKIKYDEYINTWNLKSKYDAKYFLKYRLK